MFSKLRERHLRYDFGLGFFGRGSFWLHLGEVKELMGNEKVFALFYFAEADDPQAIGYSHFRVLTEVGIICLVRLPDWISVVLDGYFSHLRSMIYLSVVLIS